MRRLKPYLLGFGGLVAAVFSALFLGAQGGVRSVLPASAPQPDLQANRLAPNSELTAKGDFKSVRKLPAPLPRLDAEPAADSFSVSPPLTRLVADGVTAPERLFDRRTRLLVGTVEIRI